MRVTVAATGISPENMEAMRRGLPEVGALVCPRCGDGDCFSGPPGCTSLALTVEDVLGLLRRHGAGRCHGCGAALEPAHPSVRERAERLRDAPAETQEDER